MTLTEQLASARERTSTSAMTGRAWHVAAWVSVLVAFAAHLWVAASALEAGFPTFSYDEIDTLMIGRAAVGVASPQVSGAGYFPLSSLIVAPVWWVTSDPFVFYRIAIAVGVLIALATIWPLARIATRFGLSTPQAVTVAGVVMAMPARSVQADYAMAEKPLFLLLTVSVLAAIRLRERPTSSRATVFAVLVALTYFSHARMVVLVVAATLWLLLFAVGRTEVAGRIEVAGGRGASRRKAMLAGLVGLLTLLPLSWAAARVAHHLNALVSTTAFEQGANVLGNLSSGNSGMLLRAGLGQAWEQLVSGFGLVLVGLVVAAVLAGRELRARSAGPASLILLTVLGLYAGSVIAWGDHDLLYATVWRRLDAWIYGRYVDPASALLVLLALCAIVRGLGRKTLAATWVLALVIAVPTVVWLAPRAPTGAFVTPAHIPGAMAWWWALPKEVPDHAFVPGVLPTLTNDNRFWLVATLTALLPLLVLALARHRPAAAAGGVIGLVLALAGVGTFYADQASGQYQTDHQVISPLAARLRSILAEHPGTSVGYDERCPKPLWQAGGRRNRFMWQLLPTVASRTTSGVDIAIVCAQAIDRIPPGSARLDESVYGRVYAWVAPGPLQDALRAEGVLDPPS